MGISKEIYAKMIIKRWNYAEGMIARNRAFDIISRLEAEK